MEGNPVQAGAARSNSLVSTSFSPPQHSREHKGSEAELVRILDNIRKSGMVAALVIAAAAFRAVI